MKLKIFFTTLFLLYHVPCKNISIPLTENLMFEVDKIMFYHNIKDKDFNEELLKQCIYYERIKYPDIVLIQARLETGFYSSEIFRIGNNLFGMKYPKYRKTDACGVFLGHSKYLHWTDSVKDYRKFQDWYLSLGYRMDEYFVFLQWIKYAEDSQYIPKLVKLKDMS